MTHEQGRKLENFDELFVGNPVDIEKNLNDLLPKARARQDKSLYLQILSQIALAQAMQQKFDIAHKTLDIAEAELGPDHHRCLLNWCLLVAASFLKN